MNPLPRLAIALLLLSAAAPPDERVLDVPSLVPATIDGHTLRFRPDPGAPGLPIIVPARARELGLRGGGLFAFGVQYQIGRERLFGRTERVRMSWAAEPATARHVGWLSRDQLASYDGVIGPAGFAEPLVRFRLRPSRPGEVAVAIPLAMVGGLASVIADDWWVLDAVANVSGAPTRIRIDPYHARTLVTAPAAIAIARAHGGRMTAQTGRQEIAFGVERPYRMMTLAAPLVIGGISLDRLGVRVTDEDVAGRVPEAGAAPPAGADPDEVVVTAKGRKPRTGILILGADALARCSSIVFDKPARQLRLSCAPA